MADVKSKGPVNLIILGMAGSGKTSLVGRLASSPKTPYVINLDPATLSLPYLANIDIRDTVKYKDVKKHYGLGPNGAIVTSLNLFSTKFADVVGFIEKAPNELCVLDTPGQIEVFTWSVSGTIITETLGSTMPTVIVYVMDCVRNTSPTVFISNMLHACTIMYKFQLPFIVVMNKVDIVDHSYAVNWMNDFDEFQEVLDAHKGYSSTLARRLGLTLDKFYSKVKICGVSAATGQGIDQLYELVELARVEYETKFRDIWEKRRAESLAKKQAEEGGKSSEIAPGPSSQVLLRHPGSESSSDSEGEEESCQDADLDEDENMYKKAMQQQKEMLARRAKEAEKKEKS